MAECIEREAILEAVTVWYKKACQPENMSSYNMGERDAYITAINEIIELPAADVRPVVRGRWELTTMDDGYGEYQLYKCSNCGGLTAQHRNYCHDCGADMREES